MPRTLRWSAIFVLAGGCGIVGLSMYSQNLWLYELSSALMMIGTPIAVLGLVLLWLDWSLTVNARTEGGWDHHHKPTLKTRYNQDPVGRVSSFMSSRFGDDSMFATPAPEAAQAPVAVPVAAGGTVPLQQPVPMEEAQEAQEAQEVEDVEDVEDAQEAQVALADPAMDKLELATGMATAPADAATGLPEDPPAPTQAEQTAEPVAMPAADVEDPSPLAGPMHETRVIEMPLEPVAKAASGTSRVLAFRRKGETPVEPAPLPEPLAQQDEQDKAVGAWPDTVIEEYPSPDRLRTAAVSEAPARPVTAPPSTVPEALESEAFLEQTMAAALARIHARMGTGQRKGPALVPELVPGSTDGGTAFADTEPFDFDAHQRENETWNAERLQQLDQPQFVSLVEAFYQQAGFVTQQQPSDRPHGPVMLWLYSQQRPGWPVSVVRCVHAPGMPLAPIELVTVGQMVQSRGLSRGQLATTCNITAPARALAMVHNINLLDTPAMLDLIGQRSPEQQEVLAERSA